MSDLTPIPAGFKRCFRCQAIKAYSEFSKDKYKPDGLTSSCLECRRTRVVKPTVPDGYKRCPQCKTLYPANRMYFYASTATKDSLYSLCKKCHAPALQNRKQTAEYKEQQRQYAKERRIANPELREKERRAALDYRNRTKDLPVQVARRKTDKYKLQRRLEQNRRRSIQHNLPSEFTPIDWQRALDYFKGCCAVCGRPPGLWHTVAADHWIPLNSSDCPGTIPTNIIPLCHGIDGCNNSKSFKMPEQWLAEKFGKRRAKQILGRIRAYQESLK